MPGKRLHLIALLGTLLFAGLPVRVDGQFLITVVSVTEGALPNSDQLSVFVLAQEFTNSDGMVPPSNAFQGTLTEVVNRGTNVSFTAIDTNSVRQIYRFVSTPPPDSLAESYTLYGTNGFTNVTIQIPPFFSVLPQNQSVFVGSNVTFTVKAIHTTGFQWLKDGTNLVDDGHYSGTTNATLSIASVSLADAGEYSIVAAHPALPRTNSATLAVFKPIQLSLMQTGPGLLRLLAANADQSPFEPQRVSNVLFYSS
ncbi:MAG TPA: immunoglobulin domain-containing protein, partial [Verrucomicrobiae bacterium]|nr:immunoglobulin domain-containing protein [Verrucomicrobiae bacterium]